MVLFSPLIKITRSITEKDLHRNKMIRDRQTNRKRNQNRDDSPNNKTEF